MSTVRSPVALELSTLLGSPAAVANIPASSRLHLHRSNGCLHRFGCSRGVQDGRSNRRIPPDP